ncbi:MAG: 30S ribosomal protein S8 [Aigarchaeota archaeon]|nr:30S ribosomal protein S8 [Aigarchaeota archaeon]MCS7127125.1 30S ribosomal protein S8 [Candidatus Calditenuaceae archaeon]MCX8203969.1 30S ribosomal protein S8 [Nitrososphaeria archaeon]MDW8043249.1 30S ribosomal protein S8 [Nitrososphaerota archaeon]
MATFDWVSGLFTKLYNNEMARNKECVHKYSKLVVEVLKTLQRHGYVGAFEYIEDGRGGKVVIQLLGRINKAGPIRPRFSVGKDGYEEFEKRYLPSRDVGILVVTTNQGVMSHREAKQKGLGGKLLGYVY